MDFALSETQQMLRGSAREFLARECPESYVRAMEEDERGYTPEMWLEVVGQGWLGLVVPERYGGAGLGLVELCVLLEETGRVLLPGPLFSTQVLGALAVLDGESEEQREHLLPLIASGRAIVTLALTEPSARWDPAGVRTTAERSDGGYIIGGTKLFVPDANAADYLIVAARTGDAPDAITLFVVPSDAPGVVRTPMRSLGGERQSEVVLDSVETPASAVLGEVDGGWGVVERVLLAAVVGRCAEMLGGAEHVLEQTVEYAKQRVQFGRPIGSFQAVQHHCANMAIDVEGCRQVTYQAAWRLSQGMPAAAEVATAKAWVGDAYGRVCALAHQVHGAIGFTREHSLQLYTRRAKAAELSLGDADLQRERVAEAIGL